MSKTKEVLKRVCDAIVEKKGDEIALLDVHEIASFTSFLVICQGSNRRQTQAISDSITQALKKSGRLSPDHVEGYDEASWILLDYLDFVVHIFTPETRDYYSLERLWGDGVKLEPTALTA